MTLEELTLKSIEILKWPVVAIIGLCMFRSGVISLLSRARRAAFGDKAIEFLEPTALASEQKRQTGIALVEEPKPPSHEAPPPPPPEALVPFETKLKTTLEQSSAPDNVKIAWLIRGLAAEQIRHVHETNYRLILGSQIALMLKANTGSTITQAGAREMYEAAKTAYPLIYANFAFENWILWPKNVGLIQFTSDTPDAPITITAAGIDFLHYLVDTGLTGDKPG